MPRRERRTIELPVPPGEVLARLRARSSFRLMPVQARERGASGHGLAGRVGARGFRLALDEVDPSARLQAVAVGRVEATDTGCRVTIVAGLPAWLGWYLRGATALGAVVIGVGGAAMLGSPDSTDQGPLVMVTLGVVLVAMTLGIGLHVPTTDDQVDLLLDRLEGALLAPLGPEPPRPPRAPGP